MKLEKYLLGILRIGVFLVFLTPLIYTGSTIFPFILGKTLYFRSLIEILFAIFLLLIVIFPKYRPKSSLLFNAILIYAFILLLATIFSVDVLRSFWSNHERMMGYFTFLHAFAFFIIAASVFKDKEDWKKVFIASTGVSFIVNFLGIYQYLQSGTFLHIAGGGQVYSTLGNYIYFGGYCLWHIFIACAYLLRSKVHLVERLFWIFSLLLNTVGLVLAGSRGPFLGLFVGIIMSVFFYAVFSKTKKIRIFLGLLFLIIITASSFIWFNKNSDFVKSNRYLARFTDISFVTTTGSTRVLNWKVAWETFKNRPFLGWGPDNYYIAFNKHYNPRMYEFGTYETWQDHAHNVILDTLNESGILGLLSYLFIFFAFYYTLFKALRNSENKDISLIVFPGIAVTAYFIQNLFVFDTLTILFLFFTILSFVHSSYGSPTGGELKISNENQHLSVSTKKHRREAVFASETSKFWQKIDPVYKNTIIVGVILLALIFVYYVDVGPYRASRMTISALKISRSDFNQGYNLMKKVLAIHSPYLKETRDEFSKMILALANAKTNLTKDELKSYFNEATVELKKTEQSHPKDVYIHMYLTQWYFTMANFFQEPNYFKEAEKEAALALELSPKRQQVRYTIARMYIIRGKYDLAEKILLETVEQNPRIGDTYWLLGILYTKMGNNDIAYNNFIKAINAPIKVTPSVSDYRIALEIVANKATSTETLNWFIDQSSDKGLTGIDFLELAKVYKRLGDREGMRRVLNIATSTDPTITKEVEEMFK